jgi:NIMA (never in mitosis gene a)-related kinase
LCIITSYCEEGDLFSRIREERKKGEGCFFPQQQIVDWFIQIGMGLEYIHSKKVLNNTSS